MQMNRHVNMHIHTCTQIYWIDMARRRLHRYKVMLLDKRKGAAPFVSSVFLLKTSRRVRRARINSRLYFLR